LLVLSCVLRLFFRASPQLLDPHSFPTRRSSDLLRDFIGIRANRAKKSGMVNITSSVNSRERSGINTILHELNPLFTLLVILTMRSEERFSRNAETELVCSLLLEKKKSGIRYAE